MTAPFVATTHSEDVLIVVLIYHWIQRWELLRRGTDWHVKMSCRLFCVI